MSTKTYDRKVRRFLGGVIMFLIIILGILSLTSCSTGEPIPWDRISVKEVDSDLAGRYQIGRENLGETWEESNSWTPSQTRLSRQIVCFGWFHHNPRLSASFFSNPDFEWVEVRFDGRNCLELKRK